MTKCRKWFIRFSDCPVFDLSGFWIIWFWDYPVFGLSGFQIIRFSDYPVFGLSGFRIIRFSDYPVFSLSPVLDYPVLRMFPDLISYGIWNVPTGSNWNCLPRPEFLNSRIILTLSLKTKSFLKFKRKNVEAVLSFETFSKQGRFYMIDLKSSYWIQGILKGGVSLYCWPPVCLVWISLFWK